MNKLGIELSNCYGIQELQEELDFSEDNVVAIYARNGLMKTSFSKTFKKIQDGKTEEIKDEIFDLDGTVNITIDDIAISSEDVFVINSFENSYESSNITSLLVDEEVKEKIKSVLKLKDDFLKLLEKRSGLKVAKISGGKKVYELEPTIVNDFGFDEDSFLLNLSEFTTREPEYICGDVIYSSIFDEGVLKKINSREFQEKIDDFICQIDEIYADYGFLEKGNFTLPKLKDIQKTLEKDKFFVKMNHLILDGGIEIKKVSELKSQIGEIEAKIKAVPVFQEIEKLLSDVKGTVLKDIIETTPDIVKYLKTDKLDELKKDMWCSYIVAEKLKFNELFSEYNSLETIIDTVGLDESPWQKALAIFEERFTVPYKMEISNLKGSIIGESIPRVEFSFKRDNKNVHMDRNKLEKIDVLSQGEKRALYLLNIIFDIEQRRKMDRETLFIVDDIADSFDYKNKYAIVEYLYEMAQNEKFMLIILSHNFDFYRTISSRININAENRLFAEANGTKITLTKEKYQNQPFVFWKKHLNLNNILALIPFMRNIIEYGEDRKLGQIEGIEKDFLLLTQLLHEKSETDNITFGDIKILFKEYLGNDQFEDTIDCADAVVPQLYDVASMITNANVDLEYKIILAMAIRHKAEKFMITIINNYSGQLIWERRHNRITGSAIDFMTYLSTVGNQTRELFGAYKQIGDNDKIAILEEVNIMTPENIHINSFMYEPILDMDIVELVNLYQKVKGL